MEMPRSLKKAKRTRNNLSKARTGKRYKSTDTDPFQRLSELTGDIQYGKRLEKKTEEWLFAKALREGLRDLKAGRVRPYREFAKELRRSRAL